MFQLAEIDSGYRLADFLTRAVGGIGITDAAKYMGRDQSTMSLAVKRLEDGPERDAKRRKQLEDLCPRLRPGRKRIYVGSRTGAVSRRWCLSVSVSFV
jgi:hypothetical protein